MLEVEYKVVSLEQSYGQIKVILVETQEPIAQHGFAMASGSTTPSLEMESVESVIIEPQIKISQIPKTDTEKVMSEMIDAIEKFAPGFKESLEPHQRPTGMYRPPKPLSHIDLILSEEQYEELGSPQFQSVIKLRMEIG